MPGPALFAAGNAAGGTGVRPGLSRPAQEDVPEAPARAAVRQLGRAAGLHAGGGDGRCLRGHRRGRGGLRQQPGRAGAPRPPAGQGLGRGRHPVLDGPAAVEPAKGKDLDNDGAARRGPADAASSLGACMLQYRTSAWASPAQLPVDYCTTVLCDAGRTHPRVAHAVGAGGRGGARAGRLHPRLGHLLGAGRLQPQGRGAGATGTRG